jgi:hypothetical protein
MGTANATKRTSNWRFSFFFFFWKALYSRYLELANYLNKCQIVGDLPSALFDAL